MGRFGNHFDFRQIETRYKESELWHMGQSIKYRIL